MTTTPVTVKGQVTLPKDVRDAAGIKPGDKVVVRLTAAGGVHAQILGWTILARDVRRDSDLFPGVTLITPE